MFWAKFTFVKLKIQQTENFLFALCYVRSEQLILTLIMSSRAGSNDFNEQKRNEQQKLEEIKVHIQHLKFIPTCAYE